MSENLPSPPKTVEEQIQAVFLNVRECCINEASQVWLATLEESVLAVVNADREAHNKQLKELIDTFPPLILGIPAIFTEQTDFDNGYSNGFYDARKEVYEWLEKLKELLKP